MWAELRVKNSNHWKLALSKNIKRKCALKILDFDLFSKIVITGNGHQVKTF